MQFQNASLKDINKKYANKRPINIKIIDILFFTYIFNIIMNSWDFTYSNIFEAFQLSFYFAPKLPHFEPVECLSWWLLCLF